MNALGHLEAELEALRRAELLRTGATARQEAALVLCSNDYLGYAAEPLPLDAALFEKLPGGAGASRLISGQHAQHQALEQAVADWLQTESALLFSSGYAANTAVIPALAGPGDLIVSDELNHASIIDGCRLSRATIRIAAHLDVDAVDRALASQSARRRWVVTETYFSMDGSSPALDCLRRVCDAHQAGLIVDEAHALGVFGSRGRGLCEARRVRPDVLIGTLSKAIGLQGAFVAGSTLLRSWLFNRARSFVFSTAFSPALAAACCKRIEQVANDDAGRERLSEIVTRVRAALSAAGAPVAPSHGPILPWMVGEPAAAVAMSQALLAQGLFVQAIRPPTVPPDSARLRLTLNARLSDEQLEQLLGVLCAVASDGGVLRGAAAKPLDGRAQTSQPQTKSAAD